jgi:hypothetical protein
VVAWGQTREAHGALNGYLAEWSWDVRTRDSIYGRGEVANKEIIGAGHLHDTLIEPSQISRIGALTIGYIRELATTGWGRFGAGGDITGYLTTKDLFESYGYPRSFHVFLRWRPSNQTNSEHIH